MEDSFTTMPTSGNIIEEDFFQLVELIVRCNGCYIDCFCSIVCTELAIFHSPTDPWDETGGKCHDIFQTIISFNFVNHPVETSLTIDRAYEHIFLRAVYVGRKAIQSISILVYWHAEHDDIC